MSAVKVDALVLSYPHEVFAWRLMRHGVESVEERTSVAGLALALPEEFARDVLGVWMPALSKGLALVSWRYVLLLGKFGGLFPISAGWSAPTSDPFLPRLSPSPCPVGMGTELLNECCGLCCVCRGDWLL